MKKALALLLSMVLLVSVSAATVTGGNGSESAPVTGQYVAANEVPAVYSVDITWGSLAFTYNAGTTQIWNPDTHSYTSTASGNTGWSCVEGANAITVTNHSNVPVQAALSYAAAQGYTDITGTFDCNPLVLNAAAEGSAQSDAPSAVAKLTLSGALPSTVTASTQLGTVTVTIQGSADGGGEVGSGDAGGTQLVVLETEEYLFANNGAKYNVDLEYTVAEIESGLYEIVLNVKGIEKNPAGTTDAAVGYIGFAMHVDGKRYVVQMKPNQVSNVLASGGGDQVLMKEVDPGTAGVPLKVTKEKYILRVNILNGTVVYDKAANLQG